MSILPGREQGPCRPCSAGVTLSFGLELSEQSLELCGSKLLGAISLLGLGAGPGLFQPQNERSPTSAFNFVSTLHLDWSPDWLIGLVMFLLADWLPAFAYEQEEVN